MRLLRYSYLAPRNDRLRRAHRSPLLVTRYSFIATRSSCTILGMDLDVRLVRRLMRVTERQPMRGFMVFCAKWLLYLFIPLVLIADWWVCGAWPGAVSWNSVMSLVLAFLITLLLGALVYRARPFVGHAVFIRARIRPPLSIHSFPSSHASSAFALATALAVWHPIFGAVGYVFALLIALGRISVGVHYLTDILVGAAIGILSAAAFSAYGEQIVSCML